MTNNSNFNEVMDYLKNDHSTWCNAQQGCVCDICSKKYTRKDKLKHTWQKIQKLNETVLKEKTKNDSSDCWYKI